MISENLKLALARIVELLPHLKADGAAIPTAHRPTIEAIRSDAAKTAQGTRDPQIEAAERWALGEIEKALGADKSAAPITPDAPPPTGVSAEPGVSLPGDAIAQPKPLFATVENGGVALHDKPLGELTDAELEKLSEKETP